MRTQRSTIGTVGLVLATSGALALAAPLAAYAGPLLSGYGGPGQGNQAILGSTLIGGSGGSGGSGGGGPETSAAAPSSAGGNGAHSGPGTARTKASGGSPHRGARGVKGSGASATAPALGGQLSDRSYRGLESAGGSSALDLSAADILYIVLAAGALAFSGLLTRRLAGTRAAKGHS